MKLTADHTEIVDVLAPLAQQYGYDASQFVPRALETLEGIEASGHGGDADDTLDDRTVAELREMAADDGLDVAGMKKAEIIAAIRAADAAAGGDDE